jgi:predicted AlkP superfamily pyrophosphatase or phosphodiesterase
MKNKLIVLSIDSLFDEDMAFLKTLPNFGKLLKKASYVEGGMRSVYPTLTYPVHASIITGTWPQVHGIYHNEKQDPGNPKADWYWHYKDLKTETLLDVAKRSGFSTSVVGWPVMAACPNVDYLVPEIWSFNESEDIYSLFAKNSSANVMDIITRHCHKIRGMHQPYLDFFMVGCATDILRKYRPDVMFIHLAHLDHARHGSGLKNKMVEQAILANDDWLGRIMEITMDTGDYEHTNFALISDHGHLEVDQVFNPNVLLAENGFITLDAEGKIKDWTAYAQSAALSCQVIMKYPADNKCRKLLESLLYEIRATPEWGVESVFTKEEVKREYRLSGNFEYILEGKATVFGPALTGSILIKIDNSDYKYSVATHGHLPNKGAQPVFIISGPDIKENIVIQRKHIIDEAPTFARILGLYMPSLEGCVLEEFLK